MDPIRARLCDTNNILYLPLYEDQRVKRMIAAIKMYAEGGLINWLSARIKTQYLP